MTPSRLRSASGIDAWVMVAGWEIRVSTPPRLSPSEQSRTLARKAAAFSNEPSSKEIIAPNPRICRFASS